MVKKKRKNQVMIKIGKLFSLWAMFFVVVQLQVAQLQAAQFQVETQVDRNQMGIGDSFTLNIRVVGDEDFELAEPKIPEIAGIELLNSWAGGRQSSSSMAIINGKSQFSKSVAQDFNFQMSPQKEGVFLIPVIDLNINGQSYKSKPVKIEVKEEFRGSRKQKNKPAGRPQFPNGFDDEEDSPFNQMPDPEDLFNQLMQQRQRLFGQIPPGFGKGNSAGGSGGQIPSRKLDINMNEAFFVYLDIDKKEVYEGEQVTANWYIYTKGNIESLDRVKFPDLKGFWKEIIEEVPSLQFTPEIVNGVTYHKALLASHALFPIKSGTAVIDEFKVRGKVRIPSQFGWGQPMEFSRVSKRTPVKVTPLPQEGKTISFSGAVGSYQVSMKTDGSSFPAHQPFAIKVRFEGLGNAKMIELPQIQWPNGLEIFDTKNESKFFKDGQSYKEFEILVIARKEGPLKVPGLTFSYFDPTQKKYVTMTTDELNLTVTPGTVTQGQTSPTSSAQSKLVGSEKTDAASDENNYKLSPLLELPQGTFFKVNSFFRNFKVSLYVSILILMSLGFVVRYRYQLNQIPKQQEFFQIIEKKLKTIQSESEAKKIGSESINLIYLLAAFLSGQTKADQEWSLIIKEIPLKYQNLYLERLTHLFDYFQILGFSPETVMNQLMNQTPLDKKVLELKKISEEILIQIKSEA